MSMQIGRAIHHVGHNPSNNPRIRFTSGPTEASRRACSSVNGRSAGAAPPGMGPRRLRRPHSLEGCLCPCTSLWTDGACGAGPGRQTSDNWQGWLPGPADRPIFAHLPPALRLDAPQRHRHLHHRRLVVQWHLREWQEDREGYAIRDQGLGPGHARGPAKRELGIYLRGGGRQQRPRAGPHSDLPPALQVLYACLRLCTRCCCAHLMVHPCGYSPARDPA